MTEETPRPTDAMKTLAVMNSRLLDRLAIVVGLFGERGWGDVAVTCDDGTTATLPVTSEVQAKIKYARQILSEFGRKPMIT